MAKKLNISEVTTTRELFSIMPLENAVKLRDEMQKNAKDQVMRELVSSHRPVNIPIDRIFPFDGNPYKVLDNEEMEELVQSIRERGVLNPLIVMPKKDQENCYELISGHRRLFAAKKAGKRTVPAVVYDVSRDEAAIMVVDSNLHRETILPSEKAKAYKLRLDAMKHQGKRLPSTSAQVEQKLSVEQLANVANESRAQIQRYIRLNNLAPGLLSLVDEGKIALTPAVELSYLTENEQTNLLETIESEDCTPSLSQAQQMRKLSEAGKLDMDAVFQTMTKPKANQQEKVTLPYPKLPIDKIKRYAKTEPTPQVVQEFLLKAVEHYCRYLDRQKDKGTR